MLSGHLQPLPQHAMALLQHPQHLWPQRLHQPLLLRQHPLLPHPRLHLLPRPLQQHPWQPK